MKLFKAFLITLMTTALIIGVGTGFALAKEEKKVLLKVPLAFSSTLPILGESIVFFKDTVETLSGGDIAVKLYEPGKLMPALEIHDSVSTAKVNAGYGVSGYYQGKIPAISLFSAVPFGPPPVDYAGWFYEGNGMKLYQELYDKHGVNLKAFPLCFWSPETAGWYNKEINTADDLKGLKIRFFGYGGKVLSKLGASVVTIAGGEIYPALEKGAIDASEFALPNIDTKLGFAKVAKYNYFPGWHQPATVGELLINKDTWNGMSEQQQAVVEAAVKATSFFIMTRSESAQGKVMIENETKFGTENRVLNPEVLSVLKKTWVEVAAEESTNDPEFKMVWDDLQAYLKETTVYSARAYLPREVVK